MASVDSLSIRISASATDAQNKINALVASLNSLVSAINSLDTSKFDALANSTERLSEGLAGVKGSGVNTVKKMAKALQEVSTERNAYEPIAEGAQKVAEETQAATDSVKALPTALNDIDSSKLTDVSNAIEGVSDSLNKTSSRLSWFKSMLAGLKIIVPTEGLDNVNKKIEKLSAKVADLKDKIAYKSATQPDYVNSDEIEKDQKQIQGLINELERLKLKKQELESHGGFKLGSAFQLSFSEVGKSIKSAGTALGKFTSKLHHAKSSTRQTEKATREFSISASKLAKEIFRVSKMLKLMITRMALRAVIKEVGNGFKSLALHSDEFNQSMSALINGSKKLGYSFAGMVGPLINALAPALLYIINLMTRLINIINQVFSALSGKSTYNRAKDFSENWADNISDANKQAKELKKTVLGFDELNQLQEKHTGGGDTSGNIEDMFETVEIESKWAGVAEYIKKMANKLFDPIKKAWDKVGDFVKKKWKYALDEVLKLGKSIARDFWKVWEEEDTQKIFENILKTVGYIGEAVGNLAKRFREAWDKNDTGLRILRAIRDIVLIITEHVKNAAEATAEWADKLDFEPILTAFADWLESLEPAIDAVAGVLEDFYETVLLPLGKWAVEEGGPALLKVFTDFNNEVDWEGLRAKLEELWEHLEPFAETVGEGLIMFIDRCADAVAKFINSETFENFLKKIEEFMDKVTPEDVANGLEAIAKAIIGFAISKAVIDGLIAVSSFLKLVASLAPLLKLAVVIGVTYGGLKLGGLLGKWLTGDPVYDEYTIPVMLKWTIDEIPKSWDDFKEKINEWSDAWDEMRDSTEWFISSLTRLIDTLTRGPIWNILQLLSPHGEKKLEGITYSGGSGADVDSTEWEKTIDAAKQATEQANKYKETKEKIPQMWSSSGGAGANVESSEWNTVIEAAREAAGVQKEYAGEVEKIPSAYSKATESAKEYKKNTDGVKQTYADLKKSAADVSVEIPKLTEKQKELTTALSKTSENQKVYASVSAETQSALDKLKTSSDNLVGVSPRLTKSQQDIIDSLKGVETETDNLGITTAAVWEEFELDTANASVGFSGTVKEISADMDGMTKDLVDQTDKVSKAFSEDNWTFSGVADGLKKTFEKAKEGIKGVWNSIADKLNGEHEIGEGKFKIKLPKFYATGGFPEDGWFRASHGEMIGRFDNGQSVVANNAQIVEGISQGVYSAVSAAMAQNSSNNGGYIANTIVVDGEVIARTVTRAQQKQNMRYSPQTV